MKSIYPVMICVMVTVSYICGCATTPSSPLSNAANIGDVNAIKSLCSSGCNINEKDKLDKTPLMHSISQKKTEAARLLIESGADIRVRDKEGFDALLYAVYYQDLDIINLLLEKNIDIESRALSGWTPLMYAVSNGDLEAATLLLDKGADIEARDSLGRTPLMQAVNASNSVITSVWLIGRGADLNAKDKESKTPLLLAMQNRNYNLADILRKEIASRGDDTLIARIFFIRNDKFLSPAQATSISIGGKMVYFEGDGTKFIDVEPGKCTMVIKGSIHEGDNIISFDAKAGHTYYYEISRRAGNIAAGMLGGVVGQFLESRIAGEKAGPFEIIELEESVGKEKVKASQQMLNRKP